MSIHYSTNRIYSDIDASSVANFIDDVEAKLTGSAGWTSAGIKAYVILTFTGLPTNNQTVTIDGTVYTFKTALTPAANEVLIGGSAAACASNLTDAINDNSGNEGVTYGTGTTAHSTCEAVLNGADVTVQYKTAGSAGNGFVVSEGLSNAAFDATTARFGGYWLTSGRTAHGLQMKVRMYWPNSVDADFVWFNITDTAGVDISQDYYIETAPGRTMKIAACDYQCFLWLPGAAAAWCYCIAFGVPFVRQEHRAKVISSIADNGSGLIRVTTATAHGLTTGASVYNNGGTKNSGTVFTALNGSHTVTVIDSTTYDLDGSTYESGYDANSAYAAAETEIARAIWVDGCRNSSTITFRTQISPTSGGGIPIRQTVFANQYFYDATAGTVAQLIQAKGPTQGANTTPHRSFGGKPDFIEPRIGWPITSAGSSFQWVGDLWDSFLFQDDIDYDVLSTATVDGNDWVSYIDNSTSALLIRTDP